MKTPPAELHKARERMRRRRENPEFRKREQAEELFARRNRLGWDTWGNESFEHVHLETSA